MEKTEFKKHRFTFLEKWAVFESYGHICIYCHGVVDWKDHEVDHIINESLLKEPNKLALLIKDYGLASEFPSTVSKTGLAHIIVATESRLIPLLTKVERCTIFLLLDGKPS